MKASPSSKYCELGGLAVAANIKCPYCQLMHTAMAKFHGAIQEVLAEVYYLAILTALECHASRTALRLRYMRNNAFTGKINLVDI